MSDGSPIARWRGLIVLAGKRLFGNQSGLRSRQLVLTISGVAIPVMLVVIVTGISLGVATTTTVRSPNVDYWIVPESESEGSVIVADRGPRFGSVHAVNERLNDRPEIDFATPVLIELLRIETNDRPEYVLAIGVIPHGDLPVLAGVSGGGLVDGDPFFANGSYNGPWTGEVAISPAAAEVLGLGTGETVTPVSTWNSRRHLRVVSQNRDDRMEGVELPIALLHLSELQAMTGAAKGDQADQFLVATSNPAAKRFLSDIYPRSTVLTRTGLTARNLQNSRLGLAIAVSASVIAVVLGVFFATSTLAIVIIEDRQALSLLGALGFSIRSRVILTSVLGLSVIGGGGIVGIFGGIAGLWVTNELVAQFGWNFPLARFHPALIGYGILVTVIIWVFSFPFLLRVTRRTITPQQLRE